ncbi:MAG: heme o synthase [Chloroflexi bacterium]|nr:heme o synthase [Chloroflexota bacterium]MBU1748547.1 heme o synthase [Chloroflexota bacterium]
MSSTTDDRIVVPAIRTAIMGYIRVTKPASVWLLVLTAVVAMIVAATAGSPTVAWDRLLVATIAITAGCAAANTLTCYIDRDIDAVMVRTRKRPLPQGMIPARGALIWGLFLAALSLVLAAFLGLWAFIAMLLGLLDNVVVYSLFAKRRTSWNIILGGFSGGLPVVFGWFAMTNEWSWTPILMAALVVLWIPNHIWNLALYYEKDYGQVNVPMLPVTIGFERAMRCTVATVFLLVPFSLLLVPAAGFGLVYGGIAVVSGLFILAGNLWLFLKPSRDLAWWMFKFSGPHLTLLFVGMVLDRWLS